MNCQVILLSVKLLIVTDFTNVVKASARAGSRLVRIDALRFLAECRKRQLNQALSVLSLSLDFS